MTSSFRISFALGVALLPLGVLAQTATSQGVKPPATAKPATITQGKVRLRNSGDATYDSKQGLAHLTRDVVLWQVGEDFIMYAQDVTYSETKNQAVALGKLRVETRNSTIRSDRMTGYFDNKLLSMTGNVTITAHGKKDGIVAKDKDRPESKPVKITCDRLDWDYETKQAKITGNIHIYQEKKSGTCDLITYDEPNNMALLQGNVRFGDEKKNTFVTDELEVFIDDSHIQTDKPVQFEFPRGNDGDAPNPNSAPRPARAPQKFRPKQAIDDKVLRDIGVTPPPIATPPVALPPTDETTPPAPPAEEN